MLIYKNANQAYQDTLLKIHDEGQIFDTTKAIFNYGFYILNPMDIE
jgi:hypothetical protein